MCRRQHNHLVVLHLNHYRYCLVKSNIVHEPFLLLLLVCSAIITITSKSISHGITVAMLRIVFLLLLLLVVVVVVVVVSS